MFSFSDSLAGDLAGALALARLVAGRHSAIILRISTMSTKKSPELMKAAMFARGERFEFL